MVWFVKSNKKKLNTKKVGHAGTLDKFAEGLLLVLVNKGTKLVPLFTGFNKEYIATICLGMETDTLDPEGEVVGEASVPELSAIEDVIGSFMGEQMQVPPKFSAIHVNGKRAHKLVRSGQSFEIKPRKIIIYALEILEYNPPFLKVRVECSKGTYIRSLARDIGIACGSRGYLTELTRTKIGPFSLEDAVKGDVLDPEKDLFDFYSICSRLEQVRKAALKEEFESLVKQGGKLSLGYFDNSQEFSKGDLIAVFNKKNECLAFLSFDGNVLKYNFVV